MTDLARHIDEAVEPHGFVRFTPPGQDLPWVAAWKRKTWNTNRGIALLTLPPDVENAGEYAVSVRGRAGKAIGYIPVLYELGLRMVLHGPGVSRKDYGLEHRVAKINNFTVLLQSLHLVDTEAGVSRSVRTVGQIITGKWIDAIQAGIAAFLGGGAPRA